MQQVQQPEPRRRATFLQRSSSVASLLAWKERFEKLKQKSFKTRSKNPSSKAESDIKLAKELESEAFSNPDAEYNEGPPDDHPPSYLSVTNSKLESEPPPPIAFEKEVNFSQDFTALEKYLEKKLSVKNKTGNSARDSCLEAAKVFQWLQDLPNGDNLEEFLGVYGIPTECVNLESLRENLKNFFQYQNHFRSSSCQLPKSEELKSPQTPEWRRERQISSLENLANDDNLEKWIESLDVPYYKEIGETKNEIRRFLELRQKKTSFSSAPDLSVKPQPGWKELIEKMKELSNEEDLDKWLESLEVPHAVPRANVKAEIKKFFMHENWENFQGKSIIYQEQSFAKALWEKFENSGLLKQVAMAAGTTAVLGLVAVLSTTMLSFAFPAVFVANPYFVEVFAQYFLQRQEVAFNMLNFHNQNAKPLSTAWAKQYVLWKYC